MPITPFHFGPGFLIKSAFSKCFSFRIFVLTNIIIDLEPIYFILTDQYPVHRFFHTYLGSTAVAVVCIILGRPICYQLAKIWNIIFKNLIITTQRITVPALIAGALFGAYNQVFLDSIMHSDLLPFSPWNNTNALLHSLSYGQLHLFCILAGAIGFVIYRFKNYKQRG